MITDKEKQEWLKALRSGEFSQGIGELLDDKGCYCCLGVLGIVVGVDGENLYTNDTLDSVKRTDLLGPWTILDGDTRYSSEVPETHNTLQRKLAAMNDNGKSFAEIADWIEENIPTVETTSAATGKSL